MARMTNMFGFTGSIHNLSAYRIRGSETIYIRAKGGPKKEQIKQQKNFELTRLNNSEFGGRAKASSSIMWAIDAHKPIADFNFAGPINALLTPIQHMDPENGKGKRNICLTRNPQLLEGFEFNRRNALSSIVRNPLHHTLDTDTLTASIDIPALLPGINFIPPGTFSLFSFVAKLALVPDIVWKEKANRYDYANDYFPQWRPVREETDWYPVASGAPATTLSLKSATDTVPEGDYCAVLSISVRFGQPVGGTVKVVDYIGAGKILAVR
jgi:hypothetical protein